jgi:hypothetical protein
VKIGGKYKMTFTSPKGDVDEWYIESKSVVYGNGVRYTFKLKEAITKEFHLIDWVEDLTQFNLNPRYINANSGRMVIEGENVFIEQEKIYPIRLDLVNDEYILELGR